MKKVVHEAIWAPIIVVAFAAARWFPFERVPLPCPFRAITSLPCFTCGATRSMIALAQFDVVRALEMNPLVAIGGMLGIVYVLHSIRVLFTKRPWRPEIPRIVRPGLIAAIAANWAYLVAVGR